MAKKRNNKLLILKAGVIVFLITTIVLLLCLIREIRNIPNWAVARESDVKIEFYRSFLPLRRWEVKTPTITANGAAIVFIDGDNKKFLFDKNSGASLPIASITKLMTALIAINEYELDHQLIVSEEAFMKDSHRLNNLYPGETYKVRDLIYASLIESSNTAAQALAEGRTFFDYDRSVVPFISKMNRKARELGMNETHFSNPSGLDPSPGAPINRSSPRDLVLLGKYLLETPMILEILLTQKHPLRTADGLFKHEMVNTNQLLGEINNLVGGKTGTTARAKENFFAIFKREDNFIIAIILGSNNRFNETKSLLDWIDDAYFWKLI